MKDFNMPKMDVFKSVHNTTLVRIQNCQEEVFHLLSKFDIWKSKGELKPDGFWFECPIEFYNFMRSTMGLTLFHRSGVISIGVYPNAIQKS